MKKVFTVAALLVASIAHAQNAPSLQNCSAAQNIDGKGKSILTGKDNWLFDTTEFTFSPISSIRELSKIHNLLMKKNSRLVLVPVATRALKYESLISPDQSNLYSFDRRDYMRRWKIMAQNLEIAGLSYINTPNLIENYNTNSNNIGFFEKGDHHWSTGGAKITAEAVGDLIREVAKSNNLTMDIIKGTLSNERPISFTGSFQSQYEKACGFILPPQVKQMVSYAEESDLLSDSEDQVWIMGDSFGLSSPDSGFHQYLANNLQTKVINYSIPGAGPWGALTAYFSDLKMRDEIPKFIVVPQYGPVNNSNLSSLRQIIGSLQYNCKGAKDNLFSLNASNPISLDLPKVNLNDKVIHIKSSDTFFRMKIDIIFSNGNREQATVNRANDPKYFKGNRTDIYYAIDGTEDVDRVEISNPDNKTKSDIKIDICTVE